MSSFSLSTLKKMTSAYQSHFFRYFWRGLSHLLTSSPRPTWNKHGCGRVLSFSPEPGVVFRTERFRFVWKSQKRIRSSVHIYIYIHSYYIYIKTNYDILHSHRRFTHTCSIYKYNITCTHTYLLAYSLFYTLHVLPYVFSYFSEHSTWN